MYSLNNVLRLYIASASSSSDFESWFSGSKAVDSTGKPLIVYHGTPNGGFTKFDETYRESMGGASRGGWSFTTDKDAAQNYAVGFKDDTVTVGKAFNIINQAMHRLENNARAKAIILSTLNMSKDDELPEYRADLFDNEDMIPWADDIEKLARKIKVVAPAEASELVKAANVMRTPVKANPMIYKAYLKIPPESPEYKATRQTLAGVLGMLDVRNVPGRAAMIHLEDGEKMFIVADNSQIRFIGTEQVSPRVQEDEGDDDYDLRT